MSPAAAGDIRGPDRFRALWQRCLVDGARDDSEKIHQRLLDGYNEPQRHYHTLAHIEHCMAMFDQCKSLTSNPDALELAVWFHDVIFEPGSPDNEARSAELYLELSDGAHDEATRGLVKRLIMATLHDGSSLEDSDARYMVDIDLSSFGLSWEDFLRDSQNLRLESADLSDAEYFRRKTNFQNCLLAKEHFYLSEFFATRLETQARANLARYFELIKQQQ
jgi:predicted metal-dependent HD superfamily phosphohydrolase